MDGASLAGGFAAPATEGARAFRAALDAMARPGRIVELRGAAAPAPASAAAAALLLTFCDGTTPVHLAGRHDTPALRDWLAFHTGAPPAPPGRAAFALGDWEALQPLDAYPIGTPDYPDRSATLIVERHGLAADGARLAGPGIADTALLALPALAPFQANARAFPLGLDFFFTAGTFAAALPRTTRVEAA